MCLITALVYISHTLFITDVLVTVARSAGIQCVQNLLGYLVCGLCYLEVKWLGHVIGLHLTSQGTGKLSSLAADFFFFTFPTRNAQGFINLLLMKNTKVGKVKRTMYL